ncbi:hypothetical protein TNCV_623801 [Trichonephila clavipes]|nr:hypothetical protein TNCV_623801 [Trichonephila clavipes]
MGSLISRTIGQFGAEYGETSRWSGQESWKTGIPNFISLIEVLRQRYRDEILAAYVRLFGGLYGANFMFVNDTALGLEPPIGGCSTIGVAYDDP